MKNHIIFIISCLFFLHTCIINEDLPPNPNADFEFQIANDNSGKVNFRNTSLHASSYKWNFGDDNIANKVTPIHTYTREGIYRIILTAHGFGTDTISKQISIILNQPPTDIFLDNNDQDTVLEKEPVGTLVGMLTTIDPNPTDVHSYSLVAGVGAANNSSFTISGDQLETAEIFDYSTKSSYSIRVRSEDGNGGNTEKVFIIYIKEKALNLPPTDILLDNNHQDTVLEQEPIGTLVGIFTTIDPNPTDMHTYSLVAGTSDDNNNSFTISDDQLKTNEIFDYSVKSSYSIRVRSDDGNGGNTEKVFIIYIKEKALNLPPTDILLDNNDQDTVLEKEPIGTLVGILTTIDPNAGDSHTYSLIGGTGAVNNNSFTISGDRLETNEIFDYATKSSYSIRVRSEDDNGGSIEKIFIIFIKEKPSTWVPATTSAGWTGRQEHAAVVFKGKMWVLGGFSITGDKNDIWSSTDGVNWTEETSAADWSPRRSHTAVVFDDDGSGEKIWVMGGRSGASLNDVWSSSDGANWIEETSTALWTGRDDHASLVHMGKMWILGGRLGPGTTGENDIWHSIDGMTWNQVTTSSVWETRFEHSAVIHNNKMYIAGGFGATRSHKNDVWESDDGITWTAKTNSATWSIRESHEMVSYHNKIWIFGGANLSSYLNDMWSSSDEGVTWTKVMLTTVWNVRNDYASLVYDDKIWVLGGDVTGTGKANDVWYYQD